jgi:hypothetical protein
VEEVNGASEIQTLFRPLHDVPKSRGAENERKIFFIFCEIDNFGWQKTINLTEKLVHKW